MDDAEARAAVGAVGEGIAVAAVGGIGDVVQAVRAGGEIGQHQGGFRAAVFAVMDLEHRFALWGDSLRHQFGDRGVRWKLGLQAGTKGIQRGGCGFDLDHDTLRRIDYPPSQMEFIRQPVDKGAKSHALHRSLYGEPPPVDHFFILCVVESVWVA